LPAEGVAVREEEQMDPVVVNLLLVEVEQGAVTVALLLPVLILVEARKVVMGEQGVPLVQLEEQGLLLAVAAAVQGAAAAASYRVQVGLGV
jgi:hypothetical protein